MAAALGLSPERAAAPEPAVAGRLEELSVRELKDLLRESGLSDSGCFEKADLIARLRDGDAGPVPPGLGVGHDVAEGCGESLASTDISECGPAAVKVTTVRTPSVASTPTKQQEASPLKTSLASEWLGSGVESEEPRVPAGADEAAGEQQAPAAAAAAAAPAAAPGALDWRSLARLMSRNQRLRGVVKIYNAEKKFGFVDCEDTKPIFQRDIYVSGLQLDSAQTAVAVGDRVSFVLKLDGAGRPRAAALKVEESGPVPCPDAPRWSSLDPEAFYKGIVKSFQSDTGFGFISCDETHTIFKRDVFLHHSQRAGASVGDSVKFRIQVDPAKGMPKAKDLEVATSGPAAVGTDTTKNTRPSPAQEPAQAAGPTGSPDAQAVRKEPDPSARAPVWSAPAAAAAPGAGGVFGLCRNYAMKGSCNLGAACRFRHTENEVEASARQQLREVCVHHLAGECRWEQCQRRHPAAEEAEELRQLAGLVPCVFGRTCRTVNCLYTHPVGHSPIGAAAATLEALRAGSAAKRRDGSAPPRFASTQAARAEALPPRPALKASKSSADLLLPPPPLRPVPVGEEDEEASPSAQPRQASRAEAAGSGAEATSQQLCDWGGLTFPVPAAEAQADGEQQPVSRQDPKGDEAAQPRDPAAAEAAAGAEAEAPAEDAAPAPPEPGTAGAGPGPWEMYSTQDGHGNWWWCEKDGDWFLEANPEPWVKYIDPVSERHYWWKDETKWFWA